MYGWQVHELPEGHDALLEILLTQEFDAVFLGEKDSTPEFLQQAGGLPFPFALIVVTSGSDPGSELRWLESGVQEVLHVSEASTDRCHEVLERALARSRYAARLRQDAMTDPLTGMLNRRGFQRWTETALRAADRAAIPLLVVLLDINGLKAINDRLGHAAGDRALCLFARALEESVRASDTVARIGGDEFAISAPAAMERHAERIVARVRAHLTLLAREDPFWSRQTTEMDFAAGWAEYEPGSGQTLEALMAAADVHLYADKAARFIRQTRKTR